MARDPAQRVINWFGWLMAAVFLASATIAGLVVWALWRLLRLLRHLVEG